ncbi:MAG: adenosylcobinamide-GDP ribazoletransferase [Rhizobiales bacterium]|nr:adenosylcobinamide-GDP ribazoletransferase [Hyphomicrobiales bacterium]NRB13603.1 adenosylcobinamide-GDP ribazoletransferase [Hyphomicrobiales bacterium]
MLQTANQLINQTKTAFMVLTRLPFIKIKNDDFDLRNSLWVFPLVGVVLGLLLFAAISLIAEFHLPAAISAILCLFILVLLTGALHEDGLADCADALGGSDPARRLEVMRDSQIGTYGSIALVFSLGLRATIMYYLWDGSYLVEALIVCLVASRSAMIYVPFFTQPARPDGLAATFKNVEKKQLVIGQIILFVVGLFTVGELIFFIMIATVAFTYLAAKFAEKKFGGFTGDVLGAVEQMVQIICLLICSAYL